MARSEPIASREAKLFRNNKNQAVRIPADFELPGTSVMIHRDGERLILEPLGTDDEFPDVDDTLLPAKAIDL